MTYLDVYVGELAEGDDPLDWGGDWNGHGRINSGPWFPPAPSNREHFFLLRDRIEKGEYKGKQIDWGAYAARVSKKQILEFIDEVYRGDRTNTDPAYMPHLYEKMQKMLAYVHALSDDKDYALVAEEL